MIVADEIGEAGYDWIFGACACTRSNAHKNPRGQEPGWVPIAYSPDDVIFFMDEDGFVWMIDTIEDTEHTRFAESGDDFMKQLFSSSD
ncbi:MAG: hypothetical protein K8S54_10250 [Spirochaetia bacterium]|nr:hypothetical protein [Spirochaetia bacterium]